MIVLLILATLWLTWLACDVAEDVGDDLDAIEAESEREQDVTGEWAAVT